MSRTPVAGARRRPRTRTLTALAFTVAASVTVLGLTVWPSQAATTPVGNGVYTLGSGASGKCVDVPSGTTTSGTQLQHYGCGDGTKTNQLWTFTASAAAPGKS